MASRLRRKKSPKPDLKIAVVGAAGVGKSALTVRFLTRRYIGEYGPGENRYKHEALIDGDSATFEILDICSRTRDKVLNPTEIMQWADGLLLVYSITDRNTFTYISRAQTDLKLDIPKYLVGNKADMVHLRRVDPLEAELLSRVLKCKLSEVSAADQVDQVVEIFADLCKEVYEHKRKSKQTLLERVLRSGRSYSPYTRGKSDSQLLKD